MAFRDDEQNDMPKWMQGKPDLFKCKNAKDFAAKFPDRHVNAPPMEAPRVKHGYLNPDIHTFFANVWETDVFPLEEANDLDGADVKTWLVFAEKRMETPNFEYKIHPGIFPAGDATNVRSALMYCLPHMVTDGNITTGVKNILEPHLQCLRAFKRLPGYEDFKDHVVESINEETGYPRQLEPKERATKKRRTGGN